MAQQSTNSPNTSKRKRLLGYIQLLAVAGVIFSILIFARAPDRIEQRAVSDEVATSPLLPAVVVMAQPRREDFTLPVHLTGNVTLEERIKIMPEARGRVTWVSDDFKRGRTIRANQVFVKIDPQKYQLRVAEAEAKLKLHQLKQSSASDNSQANAEFSASRIEILSARLEMAKLDLAQTEISLPYDIRVIRADVAVGELTGPYEYVGADKAILGTGYRPSDVQVSAPIEPHRLDELDLGVGTRASIEVNKQTYAANLERVGSTVSNETRMILVSFKFDDSSPVDDLPLPGMFAEITLHGPTFEDVFVLPREAMRPERNAWIVADGVMNSRKPNTLALIGEHWVVEPFDVADGLIVNATEVLTVGTAVDVLSVN